jgi:hypothetical protein
VDRAFIQKLIWTVLAIGVYVLTVFVPEVGSDLKVIAGLIVGAVWINAKESARASVKPPPVPAKPGDWLEPLVPLLSHATAMSIAFGALTACAGTPADTALQNRLAANDLRDTVNEASDTLAQAHGALPFICAYFGERSAACMSLQDGYRITASAIDTVHRGIDLLDAVGVGAEQTRVAAERVLSEAKAFGSAVQRTGEEVQNAVAKQADRSGGGPGGPSAEQPAAEASPAEDAGTPAPAAAQ